MTPRIVEPEWLDSLPPDDPRAIASRADLRLVNRLMGHASKISRLFLKHTAAQTWRGKRLRIADLGGGDGTLLLLLAQAWSRHGIVADADILDTRDAVSTSTIDLFHKLGWSIRVKTTDALDWARSRVLASPLPDSRSETGAGEQHGNEPYDIILSNLFLHHFTDAELAELLAGIACATTLFIACEPRRSSLGLWGARALRLVGCTAVTLHDARISVQAGFSGEELSHLWPRLSRPSVWHLKEGRQCFTHYFVASRR